MATRELIFDHEEISVYFHPEHGLVHHEMHKPARGESSFQAALSRGAEIFETRGAHKWLSDDRRNHVLTKADEEWGTQVWFPRVLAAGWTHWAVVRPEQAIAQLNVSRFVKMFGEMGVTTILVSDFDEAWSWLVDA